MTDGSNEHILPGTHPDNNAEGGPSHSASFEEDGY